VSLNYPVGCFIFGIIRVKERIARIQVLWEIIILK